MWWPNKSEWRFILVWLVIISVLIFAAFYGANAQAAEALPANAVKYRTILTREAHAVWGLDAPVPVFAAQIQQESAWQTDALSHVGAQGMAQFMPATAKWWCEINKLSLLDCQPNNPQWAMRALVGYDKWLYGRVWGNSEYDRLYAALRGYNGGLGHWMREAAIAQSRNRLLIDAACGKARRHISHCKENLSYPKRILNVYQPRYFGWGRAVMMTGGARG